MSCRLSCVFSCACAGHWSLPDLVTRAVLVSCCTTRASVWSAGAHGAPTPFTALLCSQTLSSTPPRLSGDRVRLPAAILLSFVHSSRLRFVAHRPPRPPPAARRPSPIAHCSPLAAHRPWRARSVHIMASAELILRDRKIRDVQLHRTADDETVHEARKVEQRYILRVVEPEHKAAYDKLCTRNMLQSPQHLSIGAFLKSDAPFKPDRLLCVIEFALSGGKKPDPAHIYNAETSVDMRKQGVVSAILRRWRYYHHGSKSADIDRELTLNCNANAWPESHAAWKACHFMPRPVLPRWPHIMASSWDIHGRCTTSSCSACEARRKELQLPEFGVNLLEGSL